MKRPQMQLATDLKTLNPFNEQTLKEFLVSFSTGFISRKGDGVNHEETWRGKYDTKETRWESSFSNCRKKVESKIYRKSSVIG